MAMGTHLRGEQEASATTPSPPSPYSPIPLVPHSVRASFPFPFPLFLLSSTHSQTTRIRAVRREESPDTTGQDSRRKPGRGASRDGKCHREQTARTRKGEGKGETVG